MTGAARIAITLQSLEGGGAQRRIVDLANGFAREGRAVDLFVRDQKGELANQLGGGVRLFGSDSLSTYLAKDPPGALLSGAAAVHRLTLQSLPPNRDFPLVLRASSHPLRRLPFSMPRQMILEQFRRARRLRSYGSADLIIAVAEDVAEPLRTAYPEKPIIVIPNQIVTDSFLAGASAPVSRPGADSPGVPLLLGIGRLALAKDFPTLLRAAALVKESHAFHLAILGSGSASEQDRLSRLAARLGIADLVTLEGDCDRVAAWLSKASLFISSSLWEGSPATIVEALAMGCPVVATDRVGTARELLGDPRLGTLVPAANPKRMAEAIARWLDGPRDPQLLRAAAAPFTIDRTNDYLAAIDSAVERMARRRSSAISAC